MLQWGSCPIEIASLVFFDIETTGLRPDRGAQITEIAVVGHEGVQFRWMGGRDRVDERPHASHLACLFDHLRAGVVVGHNVRFDFKFIAYEARRFGLDGLTVRFIDTLGLARTLLPDADNYQLATRVRLLGWLKKELVEHEGMWLTLRGLTGAHDVDELERVARVEEAPFDDDDPTIEPVI